MKLFKLEILDDVCKGWILIQSGKYTVQLWKIPAFYHVEPHKHSNIDVWIWYLCGDAIVSKIKCGLWHDVIVTFWHDFFKKFRIRPNEVHKIENRHKNLWLLTFQKYVGQNNNNIQTVQSNFELT